MSQEMVRGGRKMEKSRLRQLAEKKKRLETVEHMLAEMRREEWKLHETVRKLKEQFRQETADVEKLEKGSVSGFLFAFLGQKEERLEKEREEAVQAGLNYHSALARLEDLKGRMEQLQKEADSLQEIPEEYEKELNGRKTALMGKPGAGERLLELERQKGEEKAREKEIKEAERAGRAAKNQVEYVLEKLNSAKRWGVYDVVGGGLMSDLIKYQRVDDAQAGIERLQILLSRFRTELADVGPAASVEGVNAGAGLRFADYFFDGIVFDWMALSRIQDARDRMERLRRQLLQILEKLNRMAEESRQCQERLEEESRRLTEENS